MRGFAISQAAWSRKGKGSAGSRGGDAGSAAKQAGGNAVAGPPFSTSGGASDGGGDYSSLPYGVVVLGTHILWAKLAEVAILRYVSPAIRRFSTDAERSRLAAAFAAISDALGSGASETLGGIASFACCLRLVMDGDGVRLEANSAAFAAAILPRKPSGAPWSVSPRHSVAPQARGGSAPGCSRCGGSDPPDRVEQRQWRSWLLGRLWGSVYAPQSRNRVGRAEAGAMAQSFAGGDSLGNSTIFGMGVTGESSTFGRSWASAWPLSPPWSVSATPSATNADDADGGDMTWTAAQ
ncbi:hypothetical protein BU14_0154s0006 [Porphyra umbilicalis]|uniref:Uncharacterized protein n=1 Tax=Porphyra umbilicalis TaxID=2786 RepID=A0A1X6P8Y8_PORUM|nr:hypothetical protein BU14_0154s0006 [Porphyra umbilicalis]|eukprot:OSX77230.1 hypothetical protein BU14_0154s0006 [Porphyra umbilicalis]